jgi:hypothetical protein
MIDVDAFWREGYRIIRNVYSKDEIQQFRENVQASRGYGGDLLSNPKLNSVLLDGKLATIARQILGSDDLLYAGDSSFTINSNQHGWHKDNADRLDPNAPDWQSRYTILRFGVYLQDHWSHTAGLNLRARSHNTPSLKEGKNIYVRTRVGDVAVWSLRTSHSGFGTLLRFPKWWHPEPELDGKYPDWLIAPRDGDRMALFAAIGLDDAHHARYTDYLKTRTYICRQWSKSHYDDETLALADKIGLKVRNMPLEIQGDPSVGKNEKWEPIPY